MKTEDMKDKVDELANEAKDKAHDVTNAAKDKVHDVTNAAKDKAHDEENTNPDVTPGTAERVDEGADKAKEKGSGIIEDIKEGAEHAVDGVKHLFHHKDKK